MKMILETQFVDSPLGNIQNDDEDVLWEMHFVGASLRIGAGAGVIFTSSKEELMPLFL